MWINNKEWIVFSACLILVVPGILYFLCQPYYHELYIKDLRDPRRISILSDEKENKNLVVKIDGVSTVDYFLRLNLFHKNDGDSVFEVTCSEDIKIPAGAILGNFRRNFPPGHQRRKVEIVYWPTTHSAKGAIKIEAGIF